MSVKQNYFYSLLNTISGLLFPIITFPYVARILMADGIGQVNFYLSIINYISMFAGLGIPTYAIREIARVKTDVKVMNQVAVEILLLHTFLTLLGYIVVGVVALTVAQVQVNLPLFLILSTNLFFITIGCEWFYQGIEDFKYITIRGLIVKMLSVALLFVLVKDRSDLFYYGIYSVVGVVGGNIFNAFRLRKYIKFRLLELKELRPMRHLIPALRIFLLNVVASIYLQLDTVMLGFLKGNEAVGYYTGAIKLTKMLMGVTSSLCVVLLPRLSNLAVGNEREEFDRLLKKALDYVIAIAAPMSMGLVIMAPTLVYLFCGEGLHFNHADNGSHHSFYQHLVCVGTIHIFSGQGKYNYYHRYSGCFYQCCYKFHAYTTLGSGRGGNRNFIGRIFCYDSLSVYHTPFFDYFYIHSSYRPVSVCRSHYGDLSMGSVFVEVFSYLKSVCNAIGGRCGLCHRFRLC